MNMKTILGMLCAALLLAGATGCKKTDSGQAADDPSAGGKASASTKDDEKSDEVKPAPIPPRPEMHAGSHILIAYKDAMRAQPKVTRTKEEAQKLAQELLEKVKADPSQFEDLAKQNSDGPSGPKGGSLGAWPRGRMVPAFDEAIAKLKVGELAPAPVETPFGFHVIRRDDLPPMHSGSHILVAYKGAMRARPTVTRTKEEAQKLAQELAGEARKDPSQFEELARKHSDGPSASRGGFLGVWPKGRMVPAFDEAIAKLKVGEISDPVETPFGFHIMMRKPVEPVGLPAEPAGQ